ncbi:hypothetical protein ACFY7F_23500 [Streptomyces griseofuscus]|uniref:hypothetical protein n=1 Tax=Streptomyces griseofuscus TaxID=146922 RepID=UPI0036AB2EA8
MKSTSSFGSYAAGWIPSSWVAGGEVHGERAVVDARGDLYAVEYVENVAGAAYETEHLGDVRGVARLRVGERFAELRSLERVEAIGGPRASSKTTGSSIPAS